jgi:hypothetical protein
MLENINKITQDLSQNLNLELYGEVTREIISSFNIKKSYKHPKR